MIKKPSSDFCFTVLGSYVNISFTDTLHLTMKNWFVLFLPDILVMNIVPLEHHACGVYILFYWV